MPEHLMIGDITSVYAAQLSPLDILTAGTCPARFSFVFTLHAAQPGLGMVHGPLFYFTRAQTVRCFPSLDGHSGVTSVGFPCQPFSVRGHTPGLADERGQLFLELVRLLTACKPSAFLFENVAGLVV